MADEPVEPEGLEEWDKVTFYWFVEFCHHGLTSPQAELLAAQAGLDRHAVREALIAARAKGVDPDWVFATFSA